MSLFNEILFLYFQELFLSHNHLDNLPNAINKLFNLELLDVSHNRLSSIDQINCMPKLRILNIIGNANIRRLPVELGTCDSLVDILFDHEHILYPPFHVIERGTADILNFLIVNGNDKNETVVEQSNQNLQPKINIKEATMDLLNVERGIDIVNEMNSCHGKMSKEQVKLNNKQ